MSAKSISLAPDAYSVLFLHCCRYPHRTLNGLLLGNVDGSDVSVSMTLPLFHAQISLAPMLEAAFLLADEYCQQNKLKIVGYYQANHLVDDFELGPFGKKICEKLRSQCTSVATLLLDGASMRPSPTDLRLIPLGVDGKRANTAVTISNNPEGCIERIEDCIRRSVHHEIADFDVHLDEPEKNWFGNAALIG